MGQQIEENQHVKEEHNTDAQALELLKELAALEQARTAALDLLDAERESVLAPLHETLLQIDARYDAVDLDYSKRIEALKGQIKSTTLELGHTVKGSGWQSIWSRPSVSWDDAKLCGYAAAGHDEILAFRTVGKPSTSLRAVKDGK